MSPPVKPIFRTVVGGEGKEAGGVSRGMVIRPYETS